MIDPIVTSGRPSHGGRLLSRGVSAHMTPPQNDKGPAEAGPWSTWWQEGLLPILLNG